MFQIRTFRKSRPHWFKRLASESSGRLFPGDLGEGLCMNTKAKITATTESGSDQTGSGALFVGGLAALLASTCCLGPLVLVALGLSGAWIGNLTLLEPYRPFFIAGALVALFFAGRRIFRPAQACQPGEVCAVPRTRRIYKIVFGIVSALVLVALIFPYVAKLLY